MEDKKQRILERVKKCLAMSESSNPHEAATALRQARALMRQHKLTESDLSGAEYGSATFESGFKRPPMWVHLLLGVCENAFSCTSFISGKGKVFFVGDKHCVDIAQYAYATISRQLKKGLQEYQDDSYEYAEASRGHKRKLSQSYSEGWAWAATKAVNEFAEPITSEVKSDLTRFFEVSVVGRSVSLRPAPMKSSCEESTLEAVIAGVRDGESVRLHVPVGTQEVDGLGDK